MGKIPALGRKHQDLGNRASPPSHMNTSKFCKEKSGEARSRKPSQPSRPGSYEGPKEDLPLPAPDPKCPRGVKDC